MSIGSSFSPVRTVIGMCSGPPRVPGHETRRVWHEETNLSGFDAIVLPGGFSYGDYCGAAPLPASHQPCSR